jgi:hypothetical protein
MAPCYALKLASDQGGTGSGWLWKRPDAYDP